MEGLTLASIRDEDKNPVVFKWGGLLLGILLLGDGMRRFVRPQSEKDLYGFLGYILLGATSLFISGYKRAFVLEERGMLRETSIWGKKTEHLLLGWDAITEISWSRGKDTCLAYLEGDGVRWKIKMPESSIQNFLEWTCRKRPDLKVSEAMSTT